jgi:hypothetical protein
MKAKAKAKAKTKAKVTAFALVILTCLSANLVCRFEDLLYHMAQRAF